jgi:hypothetical protein
VGDAIGMTAMDQPSALSQGYAVMAQDSGHDNATMPIPARGGWSPLPAIRRPAPIMVALRCGR